MAARIPKKKSGPDVGGNIPNIPWETVSEDGELDKRSLIYGPYFTKAGSNSPEIRAKVPDFLHHKMLKVVQSGKWPELETLQEYIRHVLWCATEVFVSHLDDPTMNSAVRSMRAQLITMKDEWENSIYQEALSQTEKVINNMKAHGDHVKAQMALDDLWRQTQGMEPYWKDVWEKTFRQKWPDFKPSK